MLSEFIQLKVIKSHPNLQRFIPIKTDNAKFSLQFTKNTPFLQPQDSQQLIPKKIGQNPPSTRNQQIQRKNILFGPKFSNKPVIQTSEYFDPREPKIHFFRDWNHRENFQNKGNQIPFILSPKKIPSLNKQTQPMGRRSPLMSSSKNKFLRQNSQQKIFLEKRGLISSSPLKVSLSERMPLIKSAQLNNLSRNESIVKNDQSGSKKILLKSVSHQNLSPLKQKLYKITNRSNEKYFNKEQNFDSGKRNLERSDSFQRVIEQSRQKNNIKNVQKQNRVNLLNTEYYFGGNAINAEQKPMTCRNRMNIVKKVIKNPVKKPNYALKVSKSPEIENFKDQRKKIDSFVQENVVNSNMFSMNGQNSSILDMDLY